MAILYLHGFASSGASSKAALLIKHFPDQTIVSPDLPVDPKNVEPFVWEQIRELYARGDRKFLLVGTSLGGFYAWYLSSKYDIPALLVNPSLNAPESLVAHLGPNVNLKTGETFEWKDEYLQTLSAMRAYALAHQNPKLIEIAVALDDKVLDAAKTISTMSAANFHVHEKGGHRFDHFERLIPAVKTLYNTITEHETLF